MDASRFIRPALDRPCISVDTCTMTWQEDGEATGQLVMRLLAAGVPLLLLLDLACPLGPDSTWIADAERTAAA